MKSNDSKWAVVFPGQGSQSVGMMDGLAQAYPEVTRWFDLASEVLAYDLWDVIHSGPEELLNQTEKTQPALLVSGVASWEIIRRHSQALPAYFAGHSLGEYTALVCSGVMPFKEGVRLVAERGRCMQAAVPAADGAMAAILGLDDERIEAICSQLSTSVDQQVAAANFNCPGQVVISGHVAAVRHAMQRMEQAGARRTVLLPVSVPSHSILMQAAADQFAKALDKIIFYEAKVPIIQNVDAIARQQGEQIKAALLKQLYQPVQWVQSIQAMVNHRVTTLVECGPGKVLCGLIRRIDRSLETLPTLDPVSMERVIATIK